MFQNMNVLPIQIITAEVVNVINLSLQIRLIYCGFILLPPSIFQGHFLWLTGRIAPEIAP